MLNTETPASMKADILRLFSSFPWTKIKIYSVPCKSHAFSLLQEEGWSEAYSVSCAKLLMSLLPTHQYENYDHYTISMQPYNDATVLNDQQ